MEQFQNFVNFNINSTCRACLENINDSKIEYKIDASPDLEIKFTVCTSLSIESDDGFPTSLCEPCYTKIHEFYEFRQMCIASRKQFQDFMSSDTKADTLKVDIKNELSDLATMTAVEATEEESKRDDLKSENKFPDITTDNDDHVNSPAESLSFEDQDSDSDDDMPVSKYRFARKDSSKSTETTNPTFECGKCDKKFNKAEDLEVHTRKHQGLKPFACLQCDKSYTKNARLKEHIKAEHEQFTIKCSDPGCDKVFKTMQTLKMHVKKLHNNQDDKKGKELFVCEECGKVLKGISTLKNHRFLHTGQPRPHACPQCNKRYMTRCKLKDHMNRHAGIKNFECPHCGAKKSSRTELKNHINYHTKEKTYPCVICNMVFNNIVNYSRHKRVVHEGIKNYPCSYCDQSFGKAETRKHHEMTHTGEKPHECKICHKKFIQIVALKKHQKVHLKALGNC